MFLEFPGINVYHKYFYHDIISHYVNVYRIKLLLEFRFLFILTIINNDPLKMRINKRFNMINAYFHGAKYKSMVKCLI